MSKSKTCTECNDTGKYKVHNTYNPDFEEEVVCEYCQPKDNGIHKVLLN